MALWLHRLRPELDNFRLALEWYLDRAPEAGLRLACALELYWVFVGRGLDEGMNWLAQLLERTGPLPDDVDAAPREPRGPVCPRPGGGGQYPSGAGSVWAVAAFRRSKRLAWRVILATVTRL